MAPLTYDKIKEYLGFENESPQKKRRKGKAGKKLTQRETVIKIVFISLIFIGIVGIIGLAGFGIMVISYARELPPPGKPFSKDIAQNTNIYDRNGVLLASLYSNVNRQWVTLPNINHNMKYAMLSAEDANFYNEPGIDIFGIARSSINDVLHIGGGLQGASTITQQLVKTSDLGDSSRTLQRKIKELILTLEVERQYSKDQILEAYLNEISFGGDTSGIRVASEKYFGVEPSQLDIAQAAFLAGLPQAPSYYSPVYGEDPTLSDGELASTDRTYYVLAQMLKHKDITGVTQAQVDAAKAEVKNFKFNHATSDYKAPHFVQYVKSILEQEYGAAKVQQGGLQVYTSLDYNIQQIAESEVNKVYSDLNNKYKFNGDDAAMVSIDPKTGEILAMVGSPQGGTQVNITTVPSGLQPGSSIKPMLYMSAFKNLGMAPTTFMPDMPISIASYNGYTYPTPYQPLNFDGKFAGDINIDQALTDSLNVPAVETLYSLGVKNFVGDLKSLNYSNITETDSTQLSYAIGGENVVFLDHINAYAALANEGTQYPATSILKVTDSSGKAIYQYDPAGAAKKVVDAAYPYLVDKMLEHYKYLQIVGRRFDSALFNSGYDLAGKTGTNNTVDKNGNEGNASSLTFVGYTPDIVSGFWFGNQQYQGKALQGYGAYVPEGEYLIPYWSDYMQKVLPKFPKDSFQRPADVVDVKICKDSGLLYQDGKSTCDSTTAEFQKDHLPKPDDSHVTMQVCQNNQNALATPDMIASGQAISKTFVSLKTYDPYFQGMYNSYVPANVIPTAYCTTNQGISIGINSPKDGTNFNQGNQVNVDATIAIINSTNTVASVEADLNSQKVGTLSNTSGSDYAGTFTIPQTMGNGDAQLSVKATDNSGASQTATINLSIGQGGSAGSSGGRTQTSAISILSPLVIFSGAPTGPIKFTTNGGPIDVNHVTSAYVNIYSTSNPGQPLNSSPITAVRNGSTNEWDASSFTIPSGLSGNYSLVANVVTDTGTYYNNRTY